MKKSLIGLLTLLAFTTSATAQFDISAERHQFIIDSLGKKYAKKVIGYMTSVTINPVPRQNMTIFYLDRSGEMADSIVWMKTLKTQTNRHQNRPSGSLSVFYYDPSGVTGGTYIGYIHKGVFVKVKPFEYAECAVPGWAFNILQDDKALNKYINSLGFGSLYSGTIN